MYMMDQSGLAISTRCNESHIPFVLYGDNELLRLTDTVTEVIWPVIPHNNKWVVLLHTPIISQSICFMQLRLARFSQRTFRNGFYLSSYPNGAQLTLRTIRRFRCVSIRHRKSTKSGFLPPVHTASTRTHVGPVVTLSAEDVSVQLHRSGRHAFKLRLALRGTFTAGYGHLARRGHNGRAVFRHSGTCSRTGGTDNQHGLL